MKTKLALLCGGYLLLAVTASVATPTNCVPAPSGLIGWWKGESNGNDSAGTNSGTLQNGTYLPGQVGSSFSFNGINSSFNVPRATNLDVANQITIEFWMKADPSNPLNTFQGLVTSDYYTIEISNGNGGPMGVNFFVNTDGSIPGGFVHTSDANGGGAIVSSGVWHHIAGTYNGTELQLYIDGQPWGNSQPHTGAIFPMLTNSFISIGSEVGRSFCGCPRFYKGLIDEPTIFNRALSAAEIKAIYNAGSAGKCAPTVTTNICVTPPEGLVAWWPGNGNTDELIHGNNATLAGGTTYTNGIVGQGFGLDGIANRVIVPDAPILNFGSNQDLSIECWIKAFTDSNPPHARSIVDKRNVAENYRGYTLFLWDGSLAFQLSEISGGANYFSFGADLRDGVFHHVAVTVDRDSSTGGTLYVDGQVIYTFDPTGFMGDLANSDVFRIGNHASPDNVAFFTGVIDDVALYNRALSTSEIQSIYNAGSAGKCPPANPTNNCATPPSGLVSWWKAENNAVDAISGNNGTVQSGATFAAGEVGQSFIFNGTSSYVEVPDSSSLRLTNELTIEFWAKRQLPFGPDYIVNKGGDWTGGVLDYGVAIAPPEYGNILHFTFAGGNRGTDAIADLNWHHCAVVARNGDADVTFYIDGVQRPTTHYEGAGVVNLYPSTQHLLIGAQVDPIANYYSKTLIDELGIYNRRLSGSEIQSIYNAGSAGKCATSSSPMVPVISSFSPSSGTNGSTVTVSGNNFSPVAANNIVYFGAVKALVLAASPTSLEVAVPVGATYAPITVTVNGLTAYAGAPFQPTFFGAGASVDSSSFAPRFDLPGADGAFQTAIADLDGDGKPDLAVANVYGHTISLFQNIGTNGSLSAASFAPRADFPIIGGGPDNPYGLIAADVDADGKLDLVFADRIGNRVGVYRNLATPGNLTTNSFAELVYFPTGPDPRYVRVKDLDGDGRPDIVTANVGDGSISILRNIGASGNLDTNSFAPGVNLFSGAGAYDLAVQDLDGDGKPDLAVVNGGSAFISLFRNASTTGTISFAPKADLPATFNHATIVAGDVDGDGKADLIAGGRGQTISVYRNLASPGSLSSNSFAPQVDFSAPGWVHNVVLGDINGDGRPDIILVGELNSYMAVFQNLSAPGGFTDSSLAARVDFGTGWNAWGVSVGDLDGDGRPDVVFCNVYDDTISFYRNIIPIPGNHPPTITTQPANKTVSAGGSATFMVIAEGTSPLNYQWRFNGTNIANATNAALTLTNIQIGRAGNYSVQVTNDFGTAISSNALLTVHVPVPSVRVINTNAVGGQPVTVPIVLVANGNENALSFSLNFNTQRLTFASVTLGSGAPGGMLLLNTSQSGTGRVGVAVALPAGQTFASGTQQVVHVRFNSLILTSSIPSQSLSTPISFGDQPVLRQLSDVGAHVLRAAFVSGSVLLLPTQYEADAAPRPNGDRHLTIADWVQVGRFVAHLDTPVPGSEFQRADCAPRATLGNGRMTLADWVQAGRYAVGLDPVTLVGGPTAPVPSAGADLKSSGPQKTDAGGSRTVSISSGEAIQGLTTTLSVNLQSLGDENGLAFSLVFDPKAFTYLNASLGSASVGAALNVNSDEAAAGKVGFVLALPAGNNFPAGSCEVLKINLLPISSTGGSYSLVFGDLPVTREVSDPAAQELAANYSTGSIAVNPLPILRINRSGNSATLIWPAWAAEFSLQTSSDGLTGGWTNFPALLQTNGANIQTTVPLSGPARFFRLNHP